MSTFLFLLYLPAATCSLPHGSSEEGPACQTQTHNRRSRALALRIYILCTRHALLSLRARVRELHPLRELEEIHQRALPSDRKARLKVIQPTHTLQDKGYK